MATKGFDPDEMREYISNLEEQLSVSNSSALELVQKHMGSDFGELQNAMLSVLPERGERAALSWNPHAGDNEIIARLKDLVGAMAAVTGRERRLVWNEVSGPPVLSLCDVCSPEHRAGCAAFIACCWQDAAAHARVLQSALSKRCQQPVATIGDLPEASGSSTTEARLDVSINEASPAPAPLHTRLEDANALVLLLTKNTLHAAECLIAAARTIRAGKPFISVLLIGQGYDFTASSQLLRDLRGGLAPETLASFELQLRGTRELLTPDASDWLNGVQAELLETIRNVIAINWNPEGSANELAAVVEDIFRRLPSRARSHGSQKKGLPTGRRRRRTEEQRQVDGLGVTMHDLVQHV